MPLHLVAGYGFWRADFYEGFQMTQIHMTPAWHAFPPHTAGRILPKCTSLGNGRTVRKFLCFAQCHPIYSGGSTCLTDFLGVIVNPSISQRNYWRVNERTSSGLRGHWNRLSESLLYNKSHPSPSHTRPLMRSVRRPQKR